MHPLQGLLSAFFGADIGGTDSGMEFTMGGPRPSTNQSQRGNHEDEFAQHSQFVRSNRGQLRDRNFLMEFLEAIENQMMLSGGHSMMFGGASGEEPNRMSKTEVQRLKVTKYKKEPSKSKEGDEQCPICCEELKNGDDVKILPCKHTFHPGCIDTWLIKNCTCPICKRDVKELVEAGAPQPQQSPSRRRG